jgi:hypothetical protein
MPSCGHTRNAENEAAANLDTEEMSRTTIEPPLLFPGVSAMSMENLRTLLLWTGIINYGILILWGVLTLAVKGYFRFVAKLLGITEEHFNAINYAGLVFYKLVIIFFTLIPWFVLSYVV